MVECKDRRCNKVLSKRKLENKCTKCHKIFCAEHIGSYVDESNSSITKNSPDYYYDCYISVYGK